MYIWGLLAIFLITCVPFVKSLGHAVIYIGAGPDEDDPRAVKTFGEIFIGAILSIIYNFYWLDFANSNEEDRVCHWRNNIAHVPQEIYISDS